MQWRRLWRLVLACWLVGLGGALLAMAVLMLFERG